MTKNIFIYIGIILLSIVLRVVALVVYPVAFLFREKIRTFAGKRFAETPDRVFQMNKGCKKWKLYLHPYFWLWCFTTNSVDFDGPEWYLKDKKFDWLFDLINADVLNKDIWFDTVYKLRYFYICYRWNALRNPAWAFSEWFFREGKWKDGTEKFVYCDPAKGSIYTYWDIMPQLKWDEGNDGGKVLRFQTDDTPVEQIWLCTHLGKKKLRFVTHKGNKRFMYCYAKITYLSPLKLNLIIEHQFGWNYWNGMVILHFKHILRKI